MLPYAFQARVLIRGPWMCASVASESWSVICILAHAIESRCKMIYEDIIDSDLHIPSTSSPWSTTIMMAVIMTLIIVRTNENDCAHLKQVCVLLIDLSISCKSHGTPVHLCATGGGYHHAHVPHIYLFPRRALREHAHAAATRDLGAT